MSKYDATKIGQYTNEELSTYKIQTNLLLSQFKKINMKTPIVDNLASRFDRISTEITNEMQKRGLMNDQKT